MGLAALGYMAYRAYQDHQSKTGGSAGRSSSGGGIAGMVQDVADRLGVNTQGDGRGTGAMPGGGEEDPRQDEQAAESFSDRPRCCSSGR